MPKYERVKIKEVLNLKGHTCKRPYQLLFFHLQDGSQATCLSDYDATYVDGDEVPIVIYQTGRHTRIELDG